MLLAAFLSNTAAAAASEGLLVAQASSSAAAVPHRGARSLLKASSAASRYTSGNRAKSASAAFASATAALLGTRSNVGPPPSSLCSTGSRGIPRASPLDLHHSLSRTAIVSRIAMAAPLSTAAAAAALSDSSASATSIKPATLETLGFDNQAIRELPVDPERDNFVRQVPNACFSIVKPDPVRNPVLVAASKSALGLLGLAEEEAERDDVADYFSGELVSSRGSLVRRTLSAHVTLRFLTERRASVARLADR